jgi:hypothetical protein
MYYDGFELRVIEADVLDYVTDLLVLKHAQATYGVDKKAVARASVNASALPAVGASLLIREPPGLAAKNLIFIGVERIHEFGYQAIRDFSRRAIALANELRVPAREISMTLHGVGFGLDETEAFESEVAGVIEALDHGRHSRELKRVTFVEQSPSRAARMRSVLATLLRPDEIKSEPDGPSASNDERLPRRIDTVGYDSAARPHAFVAMPFSAPFDDVLYFGISPSIRGAGLLCERIDQIYFTGDIIGHLKERIASAAIVVADMTDASPNVYLEVGYAWGVKVPCLLVCNRRTDLKFDPQGERCLYYSSIKELAESLSAALAALSAQIPALRSARRLASETPWA